MSFLEPNPKPNEALAYTSSSRASIASGTDGDKVGGNTAAEKSRSGRSLTKSVKTMELELVQNAKRKRKAIPAVTTSNKRVKTTEAYETKNAEMKSDASEDFAGKQEPQKRKHIQKSSNISVPVPAAPVAPLAPSAITTVRLKLTCMPPNAQPELQLKLRIKNSSSSLKEDKTAGRSGQEGERTRWERKEALRIQEIEKEKRVLEDMKAKYRAEHAERHKMRIQGAQESPERAREVQQARKKAFLARRAEEKRRAQVAVQAEKRAREARELEKRAHKKTHEEEMKDLRAFQERIRRVVAAWKAQETSKEVSNATSAE
ncbi:1ce35ef1-665b-49a6-a65d-21981812e7b0-CDS [Sclerotinia trifoliorum]|uniref:1ce35ef1-665b-49a6-a65d-21981812e7b0-CDS n=1 Tax=Sclerotinia trifoliorum TaxID=28548 RepID=A0A8H2ZYI7_9HELO|nr:1ce35ef1-665b-49a6-a65d-21981812e7b0-CDS [Sclerotinia trifoliorum]